MFNNGGVDGFWPKSVFKPNNLCNNQRLNVNLQERPSFLRLNSTGDSTPEEEVATKRSGKSWFGDYVTMFSEKRSPAAEGILGSGPPGTESVPTRGCPNTSMNSPVEGYSFGTAQRQFQPPTLVVGYRPFLPMAPQQQQYSQTGWWNQHWIYGQQNPFTAKPFGGNGFPASYAQYYHGPPMFAQPHISPPAERTGRPSSKCEDQRTSNSTHKKENSRVEIQTKVECSDTSVDKSLLADAKNPDIPVLGDSLCQLRISSESDSQKESSQDPPASHIQMYINVRKSVDGEENKTLVEKRAENTQNAEEKCAKCSGQKCLEIGRCAPRSANKGAKVTVVFENKKNKETSNAKGKNGYHNKDFIGTQSSDEIQLRPRNSRTVDSSGSQPKSSGASNDSRSHPVRPRLALRERKSSKARKCRPSMKKRQKMKQRQQQGTGVNTSGESKRLKVEHQGSDPVEPTKETGNSRKDEKPSQSTESSKSGACSAVSYIVDFCAGVQDRAPCKSSNSPPKEAAEKKTTQIHCEVSIKPKLSFTIESNSEDADFSESEDDDVKALSEDDVDIWNSFCRSDDPYNPLNFLTSVKSSEPKGIPKSSSAPSLLLDDSEWASELPPFSPPKPEVLARKAKKVHFAADVCMVEVHVADDWERKGPWEQMALDSHRFKQRIDDTNKVIGHVFSPLHREQMLLKLQTSEGGFAG